MRRDSIFARFISFTYFSRAAAKNSYDSSMELLFTDVATPLIGICISHWIISQSRLSKGSVENIDYLTAGGSQFLRQKFRFQTKVFPTPSVRVIDCRTILRSIGKQFITTFSGSEWWQSNQTNVLFLEFNESLFANEHTFRISCENLMLLLELLEKRSISVPTELFTFWTTVGKKRNIQEFAFNKTQFSHFIVRAILICNSITAG